jgi:predicted RNA binding protein YcfA (HicA-like mRNA interferase family)
MPAFGPIGRDDLIRALRKIGFVGPYPGTKHPVMVKGTLKLVIPNPHGTDIGIGLLKKILNEARISRSEWENI